MEKEQLTLTIKIKLDISEAQAVLLDRTMHAYVKACNFVSRYIYKTGDLKLNSVNRHCYSHLREIFGLKAQMACSVEKTVINQYTIMRANGHNWTLAKFKSPVLELVHGRDYTLFPDRISINTLDKRIKVKIDKSYMNNLLTRYYEFGTVRLVKRKGKYYFNLPVTFDVMKVNVAEIDNIVGIDRGINFLMVTYDDKGKSRFYTGRYIKDKRAYYQRLYRELQMKGTASARRRLKKMGGKENRWMTDINHCISKALVQRYPKSTLLVLEDLTGIRSKLEIVNREYRRTRVSWAYGQLETFIKYKATRKGQLVINVDPSFTSQKCPKCGYVDKGNRDRSKHLFCCRKCGYQSNDDRIAAMNLCEMGKRAIAI